MKKIISITLCLALVITLFCACKNESGGKEETTKESKVKITYDATYAATDKSAVNAYESICNAVLDYNSEVRMNTALFDDALQLFYTSFPLSALVSDVKLNEDNTGIVITYKLEEAEHIKQKDEFIVKTDEIIKTCSEGVTNKAVIALKLYNYIASNAKKSEDETISCFDTVMKGEGSSFSYSQLYEYLLRQKDIPAYHVIASDAVGAGWGIAGAELYENIYYFDIMSEVFDNGGTKLVFFGMTSEDLKAEGLKDLTFTNRHDAYDASDLKFDICRKCDSWELDGAKLLVTTKNEDVVEVAL